MIEEGNLLDADLFFTHTHMDHIQGLPFFAPLYNPNSDVRLHAGHLAGDKYDLHGIIGTMLMKDPVLGTFNTSGGGSKNMNGLVFQHAPGCDMCCNWEWPRMAQYATLGPHVPKILAGGGCSSCEVLPKGCEPPVAQSDCQPCHAACRACFGREWAGVCPPRVPRGPRRYTART